MQWGGCVEIEWMDISNYGDLLLLILFFENFLNCNL